MRKGLRRKRETTVVNRLREGKRGRAVILRTLPKGLNCHYLSIKERESIDDHTRTSDLRGTMGEPAMSSDQNLITMRRSARPATRFCLLTKIRP